VPLHVVSPEQASSDAHSRPVRLAVCICTSDRPDVIKNALDSVVAQSRPADEVIVVDQSDGSETERIVRAAQQLEPRVSYLHIAEKGLSRAYNVGAYSTSAEIIAFTDDDCVAPPDWLDAILRCFEEDPAVGLLYGQVLVPQLLRARQSVDGVTPFLPIPSRRRMNQREGFRVFGMGANFAVRRIVLEDIGGFDEMLGGGGPLQSAQDFDFSYRAFRRGHSILLAPEVAVDHYAFRAQHEWRRTLRSYGIGMGGFYGKHVRLGDMYAARLLGVVLIRQALRTLRRSATGRGGGLEWTLLRYTLDGIRRSFEFSIDPTDMRYQTRSARSA
jgi:GT2 family glycosyltransferase